MLVTCSNLVKGVWDWSGHKKKVSLHGTLAHSRGWDRTDLDMKKKKPGEGGNLGVVRMNKK